MNFLIIVLLALFVFGVSYFIWRRQNKVAEKVKTVTTDKGSSNGTMARIRNKQRALAEKEKRVAAAVLRGVGNELEDTQELIDKIRKGTRETKERLKKSRGDRINYVERFNDSTRNNKKR